VHYHPYHYYYYILLLPPPPIPPPENRKGGDLLSIATNSPTGREIREGKNGVSFLFLFLFSRVDFLHIFELLYVRGETCT
jgi:hypothetical protein